MFGAIALMNRRAATREDLAAAQPGGVVVADNPAASTVAAPAVAAADSAVAAQASQTPAFSAMFSPEPDAHSVMHTVVKGDNLTRIAKKYGSTVELIQRVNSLSADRLRVGMKLKVPTYKFSVVVDKSQNTLILKGDEDVLKTYVVSTGTNNSTPVGDFKVTTKLIHPNWTKNGRVIKYGDPENILGTRWIGISKPSYGIHGTTEPEKLGTQCTGGCVRMRNEEVEEVYAFLTPGAEVTIVD